MAKLTAPLFSFGASGKLADSLVFGSWKGLNIVRKYVIPANPQSDAQVIQRDYFEEAVDKVHAVQILVTHALDAADLAAYSQLGATEPTPRTWFNEVVKYWLDCRRAGKIPVIYTDGTISDPTPASIDLIMYINEKTAAQLAAGKFWFGSKPGNMIHSVVATVVASTSVALIAQNLAAFLTAGTRYLVQFKPDVGDPCEGANSGIYAFTAD